MWLEGRCISYGESLPLWPFRDLLRAWLGVSVEEPELRVRVLLRRRIEELFGARAGEIYPYLGSVLGVTLEPDAASRVDALSPEALQYRTFEVLGALLARLAEDGPVVLRDRGPALGRPDIGAAGRAAAAADGGRGRPARALHARGARPSRAGR